MAARNPLHFVPGTDVEQSATNFLLLTEIVERVSGLSYHDFVTKRQIEFLGLGHTGFKEDLGQFHHEDISRTADIHQLFKMDRLYINPTEPAVSYDSSGTPITAAETTALRWFIHSRQKRPEDQSAETEEDDSSNPLEFKVALIFAVLFVIFTFLTH